MKRTQILVLSTVATASGIFAVGFRLVTPTVVVAQSNTNLVVSTAASLKEPLDEIKPLYQQTQPNINISYNFGASGALQQQIEKGAPSDIYISTAKNQVDALEEKGMLVPKTRGVIANFYKNGLLPKPLNVQEAMLTSEQYAALTPPTISQK